MLAKFYLLKLNKIENNVNVNFWSPSDDAFANDEDINTDPDAENTELFDGNCGNLGILHTLPQ